MPNLDPRKQLMERLAEERTRLEREEDPTYQRSRADDLRESARGSMQDALAASLMKSASQAGTVGGRQADASPVGEMADRLDRARAKYHQGLAAEGAERQKRREMDTKVLQYLAQKRDAKDLASAKMKQAEDKLAYDKGRDKVADDFKRRELDLRDRAISTASNARQNKPANDTQLQAAGFGKRAVAAAKIADDLVASGYDPTTLGAQLRGAVPGVNHWTMSENDKIMDNAQRDFVSAVLRKESGAAIPEPELQSEKIKYFPQPNDSEQLLANKKQLRQRAIEGLKAQAGTGWDDVADIGHVQVPRKPKDGEALAGEGEEDLEKMSIEELEAFIKGGL